MHCNTTAVARDAAIDCATRLGWPVLPLHAIADGQCTCGNPDCISPGKHPRTANGLKDATTDHYQVADWWRTWPDANIGIATGAAAGIVVDIDPRHGGFDSLAKLAAEHGELPTTVEAATGGGGCHIFFRHPGGTIRNRAHLFPGLDVRGDGGYVVAPPSNHAFIGGTKTVPPVRLSKQKYLAGSLKY